MDLHLVVSNFEMNHELLLQEEELSLQEKWGTLKYFPNALSTDYYKRSKSP